MAVSSPPVVAVAVGLGHRLNREVAAYVESDLGWQVVPAGGPPRPALRLVGPDAADIAGAIVVVDGMPDADTTSRATAGGALDVVGWPQDRQRLGDLGIAAGSHPVVAGPPLVRVAGVGGGVGTSTVALAVAGLLAWSAANVVAVGGDGLCRLCGLAPWTGPGATEVAALDPGQAAHEVEVLARPVRGVAGLRALGGGRVTSAPGWDADIVVVDAGRARVGPGDLSGDDADLLVGAPDGRLATAAGTATPLLLCGEGPVDERAAARLLGRRPVGRLPHSARVARAGLEGRVPAGLPGSWLRVLSAAVEALDGPRR